MQLLPRQTLFDHLVGAGDRHFGDGDIEGARHFEVQHEMDVVEALNWQLAWAVPFRMSSI
jgi:hypothetical protein